MKCKKFIVTVLLSFLAAGLFQTASAGPNIDRGFDIFKKTCLAKPFNPAANTAAAKKIGIAKSQQIADGWWGYLSAVDGFGGTVKKSAKGNECTITMPTDGSWKASAQDLANKVAGLPGYGGMDDRQVKRVTRLKYKNGVIWISKNRRNVMIGITSKQ